MLAKVDVDANPALAQGLRVQGIPAVKAVWQGQLVAEFTGAIPEEQARAVRHRAGVGDHRGRAARRATRAEPDADDPRLDAAEAALERGDLAAAEAAYQAILAEEPDHPEAALALRQVQLFRRAEEAGPDALAAAEAAPDDVAAQTRAADFLLGTGDVEAPSTCSLDVVRRTRGGGPRPGPHPPGGAVRRSSATTTRGWARPAAGSWPPCSEARFSPSRGGLSATRSHAGLAARGSRRGRRASSSKPVCVRCWGRRRRATP